MKMSVSLNQWIFLIIFSELFSFAVFYTEEDKVPWNVLFSKEFLNVSHIIDISAHTLEDVPNLIKPKVNNSHVRVFINNCSLNKFSFRYVMNKIEEKNIVELKMMNVKNSISLFEDDYAKNFTALTKLSIKFCELRMLNETVFDGLKIITFLNISNNKLETLPSRAFKSMHKLQLLDLRYNQLKQLPDDIFKPTYDLHTLRINGNRLNNLSGNLLQNLTGLKVLNLSNNTINYLSGDLFHGLEQLENVNISNNNISTFPQEMFAKLKQLRKVYMSNSSGQSNTTIPEYLFANNAKLVILYLDGNKLTTLPGSLFYSLSKLKELRLNDNKLNQLSEDIFKNNPELKELHLNNNVLSMLKRNIFRNLKCLRILNLQNNQLSTLDPEVFSSLSNLIAIDLANNKVNMSGPNPNTSNLYNCSRLEKINLSHNSVIQIYSDWFTNRYLEKLNLSYNHISQEIVQTLFKSRNVLVDLTNGPQFKKTLSSGLIMNDKDGINFNQLNNNQFCPTSCMCWLSQEGEEYIVLDCREVNLDSIRYYFRNSDNLASLRERLSNIEDLKVVLSNNVPYILNQFEPLMREFHAQIQITSLNLANCSLTNLDDLPYKYLSKLKALNLEHNNLTKLSRTTIENIDQMKDLKIIKLSANPWKCTCHMNEKNFLKFLNSSRIFQADELKCNNTEEKVMKWLLNHPEPCGPESHLWSNIFSLCAGSICSIIITWTCYRFRNEIKVWMFSHKMLRWLVTEKEIDRDRIYDAFISYSHLDEWFVANELVPELEGGPNPYKLCVYYRDWLAGAHIPTQIQKSVKDSKRTIIVLSPNFLASFWAKMEFHEAYIKAMKERCPRVIVILLRDIYDQVKLDDELKVYLRTYTYIKWHDPRFWSKLKYALPHKQIGKARSENF